MKKQNRNKLSAHRSRLLLMAVLVMAFMLMLCACGSGSSESDQEEQTTAVLETEQSQEAAPAADYTFRYDDLLQSHYEKHGIDMGFSSPEEYLEAANEVIADPRALTKEEAEDGDMVYYVEDTNEFVVLSTDGYIRTYFCPDSGKSYFDRQ